MKILVTGGNGQLGLALKEVLAGEEVLFTDTDNMDITNKEVVEEVISDFKPEFVIHGAAYTNVDGCEEDPELAFKINSEGTKNIVEACKKVNAKIVYVSTDYVFDGTKTEPYSETDQTNPISVYGKSKLEGENYAKEVESHWILRTSWVYGEGKNFVKTMLMLADKMEQVKVVDDQFGRPTYALDLARAIKDVIIKKPEIGIYNVTGDGDIISWADFAREIFKIAGKNTEVIGISTEEYFAQYPDKKIARRPMYSSLNLIKAKKAMIITRDWREALEIYIC
jgi:dTDP-4-dehydrorhamnose reductase